MTRLVALRSDPTVRAGLLLAFMLVIFLALAAWSQTPVNAATAFSVFQHFAMVGLVALGLGLTMLIGEFDISVAGMFSLGGIVAIIVGNVDPSLGILAALSVGLLGGLLQSALIIRLGIGSVPVTLGGLLTFGGLAIVLSGNRSVPFNDLNLSLAINEPLLGVFSVRSILAFAIFAGTALVLNRTRIGRDIVATGSNKQASRIAGINTEGILVGVFCASGALSALGGALLSFGLAAGSPSGLTSITIPAIAAVILGGGSLTGGTGLPVGIAAGALILALLRSGLTQLGVSPHFHDIATGALLFAVAVADGTAINQRIHETMRALGLRPSDRDANPTETRKAE